MCRGLGARCWARQGLSEHRAIRLCHRLPGQRAQGGPFPRRGARSSAPAPRVKAPQSGRKTGVQTPPSLRKPGRLPKAGPAWSRSRALPVPSAAWQGARWARPGGGPQRDGPSEPVCGCPWDQGPGQQTDLPLGSAGPPCFTMGLWAGVKGGLGPRTGHCKDLPSPVPTGEPLSHRLPRPALFIAT